MRLCLLIASVKTIQNHGKKNPNCSELNRARKKIQKLSVFHLLFGEVESLTGSFLSAGGGGIL